MISAKRRFPKPTNPCRNLKIFMEENLLKKIVLAAPSVALFPKHSKSLRKKKQKNVSFYVVCMYLRPKLTFVSFFLVFFVHLPLTIGSCFTDNTAWMENNVVEGRDNEQRTTTKCQESCQRNPQCQFWSYNKNDGRCYLKNAKANVTPDPDYISGPKNCES